MTFRDLLSSLPGLLTRRRGHDDPEAAATAKTLLRGVDISAYQSSIPADQHFVICKATEGLTYKDPKFPGWWTKLDGKLRGAYHFGHPKNDPAKEAEHFLSVVEHRLKVGDLLVLDYESADGKSAAHCASWARAWLKHVETRTGVRPLVYTFISFADEGRCAGLGDYPLWLADPSARAGHPRVPSKGPWRTWALHQYAETDGIDRNVFHGDAARWRSLGYGSEL